MGNPAPCSSAVNAACPLLASFDSSVPSVLLLSVFAGYSEDGGALRGEVIPEHEFATGPVCLDDENEFPPVSIRSL